MLNNKYHVMVLFGKAGAGKDFLFQKLIEARGNDINAIVTDTTRPPRSSEENGKDYNFITETEFLNREHIETTCFNDWYYGIPIDSLDLNKLNICVLNIEGITQINKQDNINVYAFYITADDKIRLNRQLKREKNPDISEICRRFLADEEDFANISFPYIDLSNDTPLEGIENLTFLSAFVSKLNNESIRIF